MKQSQLTPAEFAEYQKQHYTQRIAETKNPFHKRWLQKQLQCITGADAEKEANKVNRLLSLTFKNNKSWKI